MINITVDQLIKLGANPINANRYCKYLNDACLKYEINTNARVCSFLAQIFEETGCLSITKENLNYSTYQRLMAVWPSRFPNVTSTVGFVNNPVNLANKVYGGRGGNSLTEGSKYIGRGFIQITFKDMYLKCGTALGIDLINHPELLELPQYCALSSCWYWFQANCNKVSDGDNLDAVKAVTKIVNGGYGNLDTRISYWNKAKLIWI